MELGSPCGGIVTYIRDEAPTRIGVAGASRGVSTLDPEEFSTSIWTKVNILDKATIMGNVYGGGDNGMVKKDSEVIIGDPAN